MVGDAGSGENDGALLLIDPKLEEGISLGVDGVMLGSVGLVVGMMLGAGVAQRLPLRLTCSHDERPRHAKLRRNAPKTCSASVTPTLFWTIICS